ncbi:MAG: N-acetylmuramoyl-L-alanine amidase [Clostridia bacterium]|nr:N-acetylmuramoyl-L-alanine amidase [Clostridia bacterium]
MRERYVHNDPRAARLKILCAFAALLIAAVVIGLVVHSVREKNKVDITELTVCIDPGHGGNDRGTEIDGRYEKDDNVRLALEVGKRLKEKGCKVIYTRKTDTYVSLEERADFANKKRASYFLSLHRNSAENKVSGVEAWISTTATRQEQTIAKCILEEINKVGYGEDRGVKRGYQGNPLQNYHVNAATQMPSCLLEMGFMSTPVDNVLFDENFSEYAQAIADGIELGFLSAEDD